MPTPILATKLYIPPPRPKAVHRLHLIARLNEGLHRKLTLISAPAGYGKTTLVSEWVHGCECAVAWLSLDEGDNDPIRFLTYFVAALQRVAPTIGKGVIALLQSPQPPPREGILTTLLNELITLPDHCILVLDDYHLIDAGMPLGTVDQALTFLLEHLPPQLHLVITTREDPQLPLARYRARSQMTEVRAADLRFTASEAAEFLNQVMGLALTTQEIAALESRTEGWIVGLQLAALSIQGQQDAGRPDVASFIKSFTGSHRFVLDYLVEEVLQQQPASIQTFLLHTSILDRMCGPLCGAVMGAWRLERGDPQTCEPPVSNLQAQTILEYLEQANLFIMPLDNERRWYRYHHLFAELLQQRLHQSIASSTGNTGEVASRLHELHIRASQWFEDHGLDIEAFQHAAAAHDIGRAERLIEGRGIPLHLRGAVLTILNWLASLPSEVMNARPSLWWRHASLLLVDGQTTGVAEKLQAAEDAIASWDDTEQTRLLTGRIASARSVLALSRYDVQEMFAQSQRALAYLPDDHRFLRANANWVLGVAYQFLGERRAAFHAHSEAIALSQASGNIFTTILSTIGLGNVHEAENQLHLAAESYQRVLQLAGDQPLSIIYEAHLGLARIYYEWNNLALAEEHGQQSLHLARLYDRVIDRFILCEIFLARLKLARGDADGAADMLAQSEQTARQQNFVHRISEIAAAQVDIWLAQGNVAAATRLAETHQLPIAQARVQLAQGNPAAALRVLDTYRQQMEAKGWANEQIKSMLLQTLALQAQGEKKKALPLLAEVLTLTEAEGFIRLFVDEGQPMAQLLSEANLHGIAPQYSGKLLTAFPTVTIIATAQSKVQHPKSALIEPLSERELEVLKLIAEGHSNQEICKRLFLALSTVKGHNQRIFGKLQVQSRTEAVACARALGLL